MSDPSRRAVALGLLSLLVPIDGAGPVHHRGPAGPFGWLTGSLRDRVLDVVDPDEIVERLDLDALLARVDVDALLARVDVERAVQRAGIPDIVAESTTGLLERTLDVVRRQLLGVDVVLARAVARLLSRDERSLPAGPAGLVGDDRPWPMPGTPGRGRAR